MTFVKNQFNFKEFLIHDIYVVFPLATIHNISLDRN